MWKPKIIESAKGEISMSETSLFENTLIKKIIGKYQDLWAIGYASAVMGWDTETYMPKGAIGERSLVYGKLAVLRQKMLLSPDFVSLVERAEREENLNVYEKGVVRVLKRAIDRLKKLPPEFVEEFSKLVSKARVVWREAKEKNDYDYFAPYLGKIIEMSRKMADYLGYDEHPYDALLDRFEEGLLTREVDSMFSSLKPKILEIYKRILNSENFMDKHPLEKEKYDIERMKELNLEILKIFNYPFDRGRLDVSAHPFTIGIGINDVRITSRYAGFDFKRSLLATIHEFGHALYGLQLDQRFIGTPLAEGASLGVHESQSRFWENIIGKSETFVNKYYNLFKKYLPFLENYTPSDVYRYFNLVRPELIRVESDEVTYNFHIILRFEMEKSFLEDSVDVKELPEVWNSKVEEYLNIRPTSYAEGILQDIHWSQGSIGYFPTYTIGTILSVQIAGHLERELGSINGYIEKSDYTDIQNWLKEKIHRWGSTYPPKELIRNALGEGMNVKYFIDYLNEKYSKIY